MGKISFLNNVRGMSIDFQYPRKYGNRMKYNDMPRPQAKAKEPSLDTGRDENRICRVKKTYLELLQQPDTFRNTLEYTEKHMAGLISDLRTRTIDRILLIGCGDSWFVGNCLELLMERLFGCTCRSFDAYEFCSFRCDTLDENCVVIGQSASGTTGAVLGALRKAHEKKAYTIGISNTEGAAILKEFDYGLLVQARREGWPTQATTSAIGALALLFASLAKARGDNADYAERIIEEISLLAEKISSAIAMTEDTIRDNIHMFVNDVFFQSAGCGALYGAAQVSCAKLRELCPVHAAAHPLEEFHHYRTLKPGDPLLLFIQGGAVSQKELDTALVGAYDGGKIVIIGNDVPEEMRRVADLICLVPKTLPELMPVVSMIPAHLFAYHLAEAKYNEDVGYPTEK